MSQKADFIPVQVRNNTVFSVKSVAYTGGEDQAAPGAEVQASDSSISDEFQKWGPDNLWPANTRKKIQSSTTAYPLLGKSAFMLYGKGLRYYIEERTAEGITQNFAPVPDVDKFFEDNDIDYFLLERMMDYKTYGNMFSELIFNNAKNKVVSVNHLEAEFSRFGKIKNNTISTVEYRSNWADSASTQVSLDYLPRKKRTEVEVIKLAKKGKFTIHSCIPTPGSTIYGKPFHFGLVEDDGWLDYALSVPKIMNMINKNASNLKFHIQFPANYFSEKYPDWANKTQEERNKLMDEQFDLIESFINGIDNSGKNFYSAYVIDPITQKPMPGWTFTDISDKTKKDSFLTSVQEADAQTSRALNMDVSLAGIQAAGGKMGSGSGSDKRVAVDYTVSLTYAEQLIILDPLYLIKKINKWDPRLKFEFVHDVPTSLNENKDGVKQA